MENAHIEQHSSADYGHMFGDMMQSVGEKFHQELHSFTKPSENNRNGETSKPGAKSESTAHEHLPGLSLIDRAVDEITHHPGEVALAGLGINPISMREIEGVGHVAKDLAVGAINEVKNHPGQIVKDVAIGAAVGAGMLLAPEIVIPVAAGMMIEQAIAHGKGQSFDPMHPIEAVKQIGTSLVDPVGDAKALFNTGKDLVGGAVNLARSTAVDFAPEGHTVDQIKKAHEDIQGVGAFGAHVAAGAVGFGIGGAATGAIEAAAARGAAGAAQVETMAPEFAHVNGADQALATRLSTDAAAAGYKSTASYGVFNLENPGEIEQFAHMYAAEDPANALINMRFAVESGNIAEGTQSAWQSAIGKVMAKSEFPSASGADAALAERLGTTAAENGYHSAAVYGAFNLEDPAEIHQFANMYAADSDAAVHNIRFAVDTERVAAGTASVWRSAVNSAESAAEH